MNLTSNGVFAVIQKIAETSSKNDKQALVNQHIDDCLFKQVLMAALNPTITYGIKKRPESLPTLADQELREFNGTEFTLLNDLRTRSLTGDAAIAAIQKAMQALTVESAELLWRIIKKDLRAGFGDSTANKACKGLIPTFPYQRCVLPKDSDVENWDFSQGAFSQEKADGMFVNIDIESADIQRISSRQGTVFELEQFDHFLAELSDILPHGYQYHGELEVYRDGELLPRQEGNGILNSVNEGGKFAENEEPRFKVWDAIPLSVVAPKAKYGVFYKERFKFLVEALQAARARRSTRYVFLIPTRIVRSYAEAKMHAGELMKAGKEGTIIKHPELDWRDTGSSGNKLQVKIKLEFDVDLEILEILPGEEGTKNEGRAGSFRCATNDRLLFVDVTVKNEKLRDKVDANPEDFIGGIIPVTANDIMEPSESNSNHSLYLPRMADDAVRTDKFVADSLDRVKSAKHMAIFGEELKAAA